MFLKTVGACALGTALFAAAAAMAAADMPVRRAGLWEAQVSGGPMAMLGMGKAVIRTCSDPATDRPDAAFSSGRRPAACATPPTITPTPGGWAFHNTCQPGNGMTIDTSGDATGDFATGYVVHTVTRMTPAPIPSMAESRTTITARWLGPCPADMKPGDSTLNGHRLPSAAR